MQNGNYINVKLNNRKIISVMIDTGAGANFINAEYARKMKFRIKPVPGRMTITVANGKTLTPIGQTEITVSIGDLNVPATFYVIQHLSANAILGLPFLKNTKAQINFENESISFFNNMTAISMIKLNKPTVKTRFAVSIPPQSESLISAYICNIQPSHSRDLLIEPIDTLSHRGLALARSLARPVKGQIICRLMNPTNGVIRLGPHVSIATASVIESVHNLDTSPPPVDMTVPYEQKVAVVTQKKVAIPDNVNSEQRTAFIDLIYKNQDIFAVNLKEMHGTDLVTFDIDVGDAAPVAQRAYRYSAAARDEIDRQVNEMLDAGIIRPSTSPWSSPIVLVKKKLIPGCKQEFRVCVDYRKVNALTKPVHYQIPTINEMIDCIAEARPAWLSCTDLASGFHNIKMTPRAQEISAFTTHNSKFAYNVCGFGLKNLPFIFSRLMDICLRGLSWKCALCYIDDVIIYSKTFDDHMRDLQLVFNRFRRAGLRLRGDKASFLKQECEYLGFVITTEGVKVCQKKVKAILSWPTIKSQKELRSFLGLCGFYRRFVLNYSLITAEFRDLLTQDAKFIWQPKHEAAFLKLKELMTTAPVLIFADNRKPFKVTTDSSGYAIGYVISQVGDDGKEHPVIYGGRNLPAHSTNWTTSEKELWAILEAIRDNHVLLANQKFVVETDHVSNSFLNKIKFCTGRLGRWAVTLSQYDMTVLYAPGKSIPHVDALSRRVYTDDSVANVDSEDEDSPFVHMIDLQPADLNNDLQCITITPYAVDPTANDSDDHQPHDLQCNAIDQIELEVEPADLVAMQARCPECNDMVQYLKHGSLPVDNEQARKLVLESELYCLKNDVLHHIYYSKGKRSAEPEPYHLQLVVPTELRARLLENYHSKLCHPGFDKTLASLRLFYFFKGMYAYVENYIKTCDLCQRAKRPAHHPPAPGGHLPPDQLFQRWSADHAGPFMTSQGYRFILVFIDSLSLWCEIIPTKGTGVLEIVDALQDVIIPRYGCPVKLLTDRHASFSSKLYEAVTKIYGIKQVKTSSAHAQTNERAEKFMGIMLKALRTLTQNQSEWSKLLPQVALSHRACCTTSHKYSPFELLYSHKMRLPIDTSHIFQEPTTPDVDVYMQDLIQRVQTIRESAFQNNIEAAQRATFYHDLKAKWPTYQVGQEVLLYNKQIPKNMNRKMHRLWQGPYIIVQAFDNYTYQIRDVASGRLMKSHIHSNRLKPYHRRRVTGHGPSDNVPAATPTGPQPVAGTDAVSPPDDGIQQPPGAPPVALPDGWYEIDKLISKRYFAKKPHYKILWKDGSTSYEPAENISEVAIREYESRIKAQRKRN